MTKIVRIGSGPNGSVFCKIKATDKRLSITGVEGPTRNGDCRGSCGQILNHIEITTFAPGWDADKLARFRETWDRWHLNDMRAGCEHQRANWDTTEKIEVVSYGLTTEAYTLRKATIARAARGAADGVATDLTPTERALIQLDGWFRAIPEPPDADSPLSGCYEVKKRETKTVGWVRPDEHPKGLLCKPCEVCGYKYGSAWLHEDVPADVLAFLAALPDTDVTPAWC